MNRERRRNTRVASNLDVALYYNSLVLLSCRARDISPDGAFVDTGGQSLPQNAMVDVRLDVNLPGQNKHHRLQAEVMHIEDQGVGLKFQHTDYSSFVAVVNMFGST
jgi:hypothetical protein